MMMMSGDEKIFYFQILARSSSQNMPGRLFHILLVDYLVLFAHQLVVQ